MWACGRSGASRSAACASARWRAPRASEGSNRNRYRNPELDRLTEAGRRETDPAKRRALYDRVQRILARDLPAFPLWINRNVLVRDRRVAGFRITPDVPLGEGHALLR